jgi:MinD superfamily P-loop ATPase
MSPNKAAVVRKPTAAEKAKMERAREKLQEAQREERGVINKMIPTMGKAARDQARQAKKDMESVPKEARDYEDMAASEVQYPDEAPVKMKKGGMVTARGQGKVMKKRPTRIC